MMTLIGITGTDGAGKGSVVDLLVQRYGFVHYSVRQFILEHINAAGLPQTRAQMRLTANELRARHGNDFIVTQALIAMERDNVESAVVESIRAVAEVETLKARGGVLLAVDADQQIRYERIQARSSESDKVTLEEFIAQEELEKNDPDPNGMQKAAVMELADVTIENNGSMEELLAAVESFVKDIPNS